MTRNDIIKMAQEAGFRFPANYDVAEPIRRLEHFAALIEKHLSYDGIHTCNDECQRPVCVAIRKAVEREREACAQICDAKVDAEYATGKVDHNEMGWTQACALSIRARGER
jgi:hypothetical protein